MSYLDEILEYAEQVTTGKVVACKMHVWSCQRFINDVKKWRTDDEYPFYFDEERAYKFVEWSRLFKHTKGVLAGKKIELHIIIKFITANIYGWYKKKNKYRRFKKMYWQVARKNAKSQLLALMGLYELLWFCGDEVTLILSAATKREQAMLIYEEAELMLDSCDSFKAGAHFTTTNSKITSVRHGSVMRCLNKEDRKKGDGLNPQMGLIDEYHAHETTEIYNIIQSGTVARPQALLAIITTAGYELHHPCYQIEYKLVRRLLDPEDSLNLDSYFAMVNELETNQTDETIEVGDRKVGPGELIDDIDDPDSWAKANPIAASYEVGRDNLKEIYEEALTDDTKMRDFLTKNVNVWINKSAFGYMDIARWNSCGVTFDEFLELVANNTERLAFVGIDLSARIDLTSVTFEFKGSDGKYYVHSHSFMPSDILRSKVQTDHVPYDIWVDKGFITLTEGNVVDPRHVKSFVMEAVALHGWVIEEVCIDPWGATQISNDFTDEGVEVVDVIQGMKTLAPPTKDFRDEVYASRVIHSSNPVLEWAMGNAVTKLDFNQNFMLDKSKSTQRIDPAAATMNAHSRCMSIEVKPQQRVFFL